jgi:hypothetical protein
MAALLLLAAFLAAPTPTPDASGPRVPEGVWGGLGIAVRIGGSGAEIEFDCARGTIDGPLRLDERGRFEVAGTFERGRPGPVRMGEAPKTEPARYRGTLNGQILEFEVIPSSTGKPMGPFSAKLGGPSRIRSCL